MKQAERQTRSYLMNLFETHGFSPRSDRGQNFLIDLNIIEFVVEQAELCSDDVVLEVGSGTGGMTTFMAALAGHVISVELDPNMHFLASKATQPYPNVTLLNCDALKNKNHFAPQVLSAVEEALGAAPERRLKLVANLPYNIATPVVSNLVATEVPWTRMVVTIQYELALRMRARPSTSHYGALSVWLQSQADVSLLKKLGPTVFWPRPKVNSAVVRLRRNHEKQRQIADREFFQDFIRRLFNTRRKLLRSVLVGMYRKELSKPDIDELLNEQGLAEQARAEELDVPALVRLADAIRTRVHGPPDSQDAPARQAPDERDPPSE